MPRNRDFCKRNELLAQIRDSQRVFLQHLRILGYYDNSLTNTTPIAITLSIRESEKTEGKTKDIMSAVRSKVTSLGSTIKSTDNGVVVDLYNGKYGLCMLDQGQIIVIISPNASSGDMINALMNAGQALAEDYIDENAVDTAAADVIDY